MGGREPAQLGGALLRSRLGQHKPEWLTRKRRTGPLLDAAGWPRRRGRRDTAFRTEVEETVGRRAFAVQAVRAFNSFDAEPNLKFTKAYEVYSSRFQKEDFGGGRHPKTLTVAEPAARG